MPIGPRTPPEKELERTEKIFESFRMPTPELTIGDLNVSGEEKHREQNETKHNGY